MSNTPHRPLKPEVFYVLMVLLDGERHGYAMMHEIERRTDGDVRILPGALYRHLQRLLEDGLITELDRRRIDEHGDERRRYYAITNRGRRVVEAEVKRMAHLVEQVRNRNVVKDRGVV